MSACGQLNFMRLQIGQKNADLRHFARQLAIKQTPARVTAVEGAREQLRRGKAELQRHLETCDTCGGAS